MVSSRCNLQIKERMCYSRSLSHLHNLRRVTPYWFAAILVVAVVLLASSCSSGGKPKGTPAPAVSSFKDIGVQIVGLNQSMAAVAATQASEAKSIADLNAQLKDLNAKMTSIQNQLTTIQGKLK